MSETLTIDQVQELINSTVSGLAARQEKQFQKMLTPITEQLSGFSSTFEELKQQPKTEPKKGDQTQTQDPKIAVLERQLNELKAQNEATQAKALKAERENALSKALGSFTFANDTARETAFKVFSNDIQATSDGQYVIGDQPLEVAVKTKMNDLTGLLAPKAVGGSGTTSGNAGSGPTGLPAEIKPGMKTEEYQAIFANIQRQMNPGQN
jgi:hypothetical protein